MQPLIIVVAGVSGSGKSTIGEAVATRLGWQFADGDSFHSPANVAKMHAGHPLTDADRAPWLAEIASWIAARCAAGSGGVVACSALKRRYRDVLRAGCPEGVRFACLVVPQSVLALRMGERPGHFMPASLLASQLADLEPVGADEPGGNVDASGDVDATVAAVLAMLAGQPTAASNAWPTP